MNKHDKIAFIENFLNDSRDAFLQSVDAMPDEWDGMELREYVAYRFQQECYMSNPYKKKDYRKRLNDFKKTIVNMT